MRSDELTSPTGNADDSRNVYWKAASTRGSSAHVRSAAAIASQRWSNVPVSVIQSRLASRSRGRERGVDGVQQREVAVVAPAGRHAFRRAAPPAALADVAVLAERRAGAGDVGRQRAHELGRARAVRARRVEPGELAEHELLAGAQLLRGGAHELRVERRAPAGARGVADAPLRVEERRGGSARSTAPVGRRPRRPRRRAVAAHAGTPGSRR